MIMICVYKSGTYMYMNVYALGAVSKMDPKMDQTWIKHIQAERCPMMALRLAGDRSRLCLTDPMASPRSNLDDAMTNFVQSRSRLDNLRFPN